MANAKLGRPPYRPTPKARHRVSVCAGGGMSHDEIALALAIDRNTLEKHFEYELSIGAYERRAEVIEAMYRTAINGNVTAQRAFVALSPPLAAPPVPKPDKPAKAEPVGKKEQQQADAIVAQVGTEWADVLPRFPGAMQ